MNQLHKLRAWANRDDGKVFQVGNYNLSKIEIAGYCILIAALLSGLVHTKVGSLPSWVGWTLFGIGILLVFVGGFKNMSKSN